MKNNINKQLANITSELIGDDPNAAADWISWIFDIQNKLVAVSHFCDLTEIGSRELASKFAQLKIFFDQIRQQQKII